MVLFEFNAFYDNDHESKRVLTMENFATLFCLYTVKLHKVNSIGNNYLIRVNQPRLITLTETLFI